MVKLGALYKGNAKPTNQRHNGGYLNDKLEFNQRLEERRLMKEEQKYWDSANVDEQQLQVSNICITKENIIDIDIDAI